MSLPSAIIFINADINDGIKNTLSSQLYIDEIMTDTEFDARILLDPSYPDQIHFNEMRIIVVLQDFRNYTNRNLADIVMFLKLGLAHIEINKLGPPGLALPIQHINIYQLLRYVKSDQVVILPAEHCPPKHHHLRGIVADQLADSSGIYCPNPDNERNNESFKNRK